jgi:hypothetical protein
MQIQWQVSSPCSPTLPIARELWDMLLCLLGVTWVMPYSVPAMLRVLGRYCGQF